MIPWVLPASYETFPDILVVVGMLVVEIFLLVQILPRRGPAPPLTRMVLGSSLLLGSSGLLMAIVSAALAPSLSSYTIVLGAFNGMMLVPIGIWLCVLVLLQDRKIDARSWWWPVLIATMATIAEVLMGVVFVVADGTTPITVAAVSAGALLSAWFLWSMAVTMIALLIWVRMDRAIRLPLLGLAASAIAAPWVSVDPVFGLALMAGLMALTLLGMARLVERSPLAQLPTHLGLASGVVLAFLAMVSAGSWVALAPTAVGAQIAFGGVMLAVMAGEFVVLIREGLRPSMSPPSEIPTPSIGPVGAGAPGPAAP
jgi:hypothetical protein